MTRRVAPGSCAAIRERHALTRPVPRCFQVKQSLLATGAFKDDTLTHILSVSAQSARLVPASGAPSADDAAPAQGLGAGFVAVCVGSPVDVVKSRVMGDKTVRRYSLCLSHRHVWRSDASRLASAARPQKQYSGMFDCFRKTYANEGALAFYKGFLPNFARLGSWNVVMFLSLEKVRKLYTENVM